MNKESLTPDPAPAPEPGAGAEAAQPAAPASPAAPSAQSRAAGCLPALGWLGAAWVLPCFSLNFYHLAAKRRTGSAVAFFLAAAFVITSLQTCGVLWALIRAGSEMRQAFDTGRFPKITIANGEAAVDGPQPMVFVDEQGTWVAIDTTGQYTGIDRQRYRQGMLLTQRTLVVLSNSGQYQVIPLGDLQRAFEADPILIDGDTAVTYWTGVSLVILIVVFFSLIVWNVLVRLAYVALIALVGWGIAGVLRPGTGFGPVLITGLYAVVPAIFIHFLLSQINFSFPLVTTFFLIIFWGIGLAAALWPRTADLAPATANEYFRADRPLRGWRALIALPLLIDIVLEMIFKWNAWYVTWPLTVFTLIALLAVSLWPLTKLASRPASQ